jgi:hypothetical protein
MSAHGGFIQNAAVTDKFFAEFDLDILSDRIIEAKYRVEEAIRRFYSSCGERLENRRCSKKSMMGAFF